MYENKKQKLIPPVKFLRRMLKSIALGVGIVLVCLAFGMVGYHYFENLPWVDAFAEASMILSGMGPLSPLKTTEGKLFAGTYALFSGVIFLVVIAIIFGPIFHRFFHKFHLEEDKTR